MAFVGDVESHGTNVAGMVAGQSVITDPEWVGPINPLYAGAAAIGGAGGPVAQGMAPDAVIAAFQRGWDLPIDAWVASLIGFDGVPQSGDEAQLVNNSWGYSDINNDGWDFVSRFGQYANETFAPDVTLFVATGNGGAGYGTTAQPNGAALIGVGASTSFGTLTYFEWVAPEQFTYGAVVPWSNRGPGAQEAVDPEIVCVGAYGTGVWPLNAALRLDFDGNVFTTGQGAYDGFGGTSMASPVCTGIGALVYDAFEAANGAWPTYGQTRELLLAGATDLGYDGLTQGAGNANADRATDLALGEAVHVSPVQWAVGDYRGQTFPAYATIAQPGESYEQTLTIHNPTGSATRVKLADTLLTLDYEDEIEVTLPPFDETNFIGQPTWLADVTALIAQRDPDLVIAQTVSPLDAVDPDGNYELDSYSQVVFYDWTDRNGDGNLWTDDNGNGFVDVDEIDFDADGIYEFNPFNQTGALTNNQQVNVGREALSRRHDGVFLGLFGPLFNPDAELPVTISLRFYKKVDWPWLSLSGASVNVPAGGTKDVTATLAVPGNTRPGLYQGAVEASGQVIPVVVQVAADGTAFDFGATALDEPPSEQLYDNGRVAGMVDWGWRPETGDWRFFFYDVPDGTAEPGKSLVVDTQWPAVPTDVDTLLFGPEPDDFSDILPDFFGPNTLAEVGGSTNTWIGGGTWLFDTVTGGPHEIVSGPLKDGLGTVVLHNVLSGGEAFADAVVGETYAVEVAPYPAGVTAARVPGSSPLMATAEWTMTFSSEKRLEDGFEAIALGVGWERTNAGRRTQQDDPEDVCTASFVTPLRIAPSGGSLLLTTTSTVAGLDIDLFLVADDGDRLFDCEADLFLGGSLTPTAEEMISVKLLPGGDYWVLVHGWNVPGGVSVFDLTKQVIEGQDLTLENLPVGPLEANAPVTFDVLLETAYVPGTHPALLYIGPEGAPLAIRVPIEVTIPPAADAYRVFAPVARR